ncbi:glycosyltransferase family 4 protein [Pseudomonas psychrophila]|uniref:Glycosyltransferase family 4 protein n=1 Tax=Pseudomonas psychrophila TaxID=122355 RepID=A0ABY0VV85_9PSED|nr:glycosyltransferase family 4 protein [Pseudomonas psychrophila]KAB0489597.1 glycosyltransferase family 4 protein [Pseudomonas psychrophila]QIE33137.1 glycosyltransferase family 4 protein [Pseudomonas psychrophila]WVI99700.1 glycosyltransferase family 4 protein [Pseudomonas psychrophila]SDU57294.1 hypothetical protein SAMN04490201_2764 [Pseudomonas psychrophila]
MKILIISNFSMSQNTPRAFRAKSLHDTFIKEGHDVEFISAHQDNANQTQTHQTDKRHYFTSKLRGLTSLLLSSIFPDGKNFFRTVKLLKKINHHEIDLTISIGLPFSVHLITALAVKSGKLSTTKLIADYGDPYSMNPSALKPFYAEQLERWTLARFDKITIPTENAVTAYENITDLDKVVIIPQGYNIDQDFSSNYKKNKIPNFCFAGNLYKKIRNPKTFLDMLTTIDQDFVFHIYTDYRNTETMEILTPYKDKLKSRLALHSQIPRKQCITTMSSMDFLVNFSNKSTNQAPSKIIDYTLSSRPFIEIAQDQKDFENFLKFLEFDFSGFIKPDISRFDENRIAEKFLKLF